MLIQPYIHPPADRNRLIAPDPPVLSVARSTSGSTTRCQAVGKPEPGRRGYGVSTTRPKAWRLSM